MFLYIHNLYVTAHVMYMWYVYTCGHFIITSSHYCIRNSANLILYLFKEWVSFFLGHGIWIAVRNKQIAWTAKRFSCDLFVPHCDSYPMNREKKTLIPLYLQCLQQRPLLKFSEQSKKFKFPAEIGHLTLFPDKTIIAYSFRQNSAWINGEKVVCCECFHTLKQY